VCICNPNIRTPWCGVGDCKKPTQKIAEDNLEIVRVLRVLEYVGKREWIEDTLQRGSVPINGSKFIDSKTCIKSALIDQFPEKSNSAKSILSEDIGMEQLKEIVKKVEFSIHSFDKIEEKVTISGIEAEILINALRFAYLDLQ
jgi:hypothetical protein